jgi:hypothetical protein
MRQRLATSLRSTTGPLISAAPRSKLSRIYKCLAGASRRLLLTLSVCLCALDGLADERVSTSTDGFFDTMAPAVQGAREVLVDVPSVFFGARYQAGNVEEWRYSFFPDGSGTVSRGTRESIERLRFRCTQGVACTVTRDDGSSFVVTATGASAPSLPSIIDGDALARYLAAWILASTGSAPPSEPIVSEDVKPLIAPPTNASQPPLVVELAVESANIAQSDRGDVGVLVAAALPRRVRVAEPDIYFQSPRQFRMAGHPLPGSGLLANHERVGATVIGHALAQGRWQSFHLAGEAVERGLGPIAVHFAKNDKACLALDQGTH